MSRFLVIPLLSVAVVGCGVNPVSPPAGNNRPTPPTIDMTAFSRDFMWGAGSSSHQAEGNDVDSDWWEFELAGRTKSRQLSGAAADHWNRFEEDFDHLASLNLDTYRLSLSWARLFPRKGMSEPDPEAVAHYDAVFEALKARNIRPMVTLLHFCCPAWVTNEDRWASGAAIGDFEQLAHFAAQRWGQYVDWWITVNEPEVHVFHGWLRGVFPPGKINPFAALVVTGNFMRAHAVAYHRIHAHDTIDADGDGQAAQVGIAKLIVPVQPARPTSPIDQIGSVILGDFTNSFWFIANQTGILQLQLPFGPGVNQPIENFRNTLDFIGVNYYSRQVIRIDPIFGIFTTPPAGSVVSTLGIEVYPPGLSDSLDFAAQWGPPLIITENGIADDGDVNREQFINGHLAELSRYMKEHPDVRVMGYVHWALTDNFEWENGFGPRFGLFAVDYETQQRTMRPSAAKFAELVAAIKAMNP